MGVFEPIFFLCIQLPILILIDGSKKWSKYLNEEDPWNAFLWTLLIILVCVLIILLLMGYR